MPRTTPCRRPPLRRWHVSSRYSRLGQHALSGPHETRMATSGADAPNSGGSRWRPITTAAVLRQVPRPSSKAPAKLLRLRASSPRPALAQALSTVLTTAKSRHPPIRQTNQRLRAQFRRFHHPPTRPSQHHASTTVTTHLPQAQRPHVPESRHAQRASPSPRPANAQQCPAAPSTRPRPARKPLLVPLTPTARQTSSQTKVGENKGTELTWQVWAKGL